MLPDDPTHRDMQLESLAADGAEWVLDDGTRAPCGRRPWAGESGRSDWEAWRCTECDAVHHGEDDAEECCHEPADEWAGFSWCETASMTGGSDRTTIGLDDTGALVEIHLPNDARPYRSVRAVKPGGRLEEIVSWLED